MTLTITSLHPDFAISAQISPNDLSVIAQQGFKTVFNHRPDGEGGETQPLSAELARAAQAVGLSYQHLPVLPGQYSQVDVAQMRALLAQSERPILAFCRTGTRARQLYDLALALPKGH